VQGGSFVGHVSTLQHQHVHSRLHHLATCAVHIQHSRADEDPMTIQHML
jgi:hypothetical protein